MLVIYLLREEKQLPVYDNKCICIEKENKIKK